MAIKDHFEGKRDLGLIDPRKLTIDPEYNVRDLEKPEAREGLDYLKALIRVTGVQIALRIREDGVREDGSPNLIIVRGHRRLKVVMELIEEGHPIKLVPVTQEPRGTTPADRNWDLIDSNSEEPLKGFERADALYRQIHTFGWAEKEIRRRTGKSQQWLDQQLELRTVAPEAKQMVDAGQASLTVVRQATKEHGAQAVEVLKKARAANPNKKVTPKAVAKVTGKSSKQKQATDNLLNFVSVANKIEDEGKRAGGVDLIDPTKLAALARETVTALAKAKGQKVEDISDTADQTDRALFDEQNKRTVAVTHTPNEIREQFQQAFENQPQEPHAKILPSGTTFPTRNNLKPLIDALEPFAALAEFNDLNARADDDMIEVKVSDVKRAWEVYTAATGGQEEVAA